MTMSSNTTSSAPSSRALAQQRYNQALELEKQLRAFLQSKGPFDPSVRALRNRICESYEAVILEDHELSEAHEVEQGIWRLHYKCIEEFRARIRKSTAAPAASSPATPMSAAKAAPVRRDTSHKVLAVFKSFLAEATGFYHNLILKLRAKHGLPQDYSPFEVEPGGPARDERRTAELKGCDLSCHRCLIFLGDLARYKESHGDADVRSRDWSVAAGYYQQAISLWPSSGNPHNQLAVLATYVGDELLAVYRYFRSLAVEGPFLTARDNLIILFEKNRNYYSQLPTQEAGVFALKLDAGKRSEKVKSGRGDRILPVGDGSLKLAVKDSNLEVVDIGEVRKSFRIRFVRLNGILFTRTSLETFAEVYAATVRELEMLLATDDASLEAGLGLDHRSGIGTGSTGAAGFVQFISVLIFTVHNINWGPDSHHPSYAEILQRSALFQHAFTAAFECAGRLMRRCTDFNDVSKCPLLPAMLVFMEWLACRPEMATGSDINEKQASARAFFWRQSVALLNSCTDTYKGHGDTGFDGALRSPSTFDGDESLSGGVALWEDYELRGFVAIVPAQITLDYSKRAPRTGLGDKKEREVRIQRLLAAGKAIADSLEGTKKGIFYDEETEKFVMAEDAREKKVVCANGTTGLENMGLVPDDGLDPTLRGSSRVKDLVGRNGARGSSKVATLRREEEDEEVIVFKPVLKESQVLSSSEVVWKGSAGAQTTALNSSEVPAYSRDLKVVKQVSLGLQSPVLDLQGLTPVTSDGKQFVLEVTSPCVGTSGITSAPQELESPGVALRSNSADFLLPSLAAVHDLLKDDDNAKGLYGYAPSCAEDWLNHVGRSSAGFSSTTLPPWDVQSAVHLKFGNGPEKVPISAGVIGQPKPAPVSKSLWSTTLDSLSSGGFSDLSLGKLDYSKGYTGSLGGGMPNPTFCLDSLIQASVKEANGSAHNAFSSSSSANEMAYTGNFHRSNARNGMVGYSQGQKISPAYAVAGNSGSLVDPKPENPAPLSHKFANFSNGTSAPLIISSRPTTKDNTATLARPSGMRPPPGFGPLPSKPATSSVGTDTAPKSSSKVQKGPYSCDGGKRNQVDDYGWLDDYSYKDKLGQTGYYQGQGSSLYSSDYGIWSNAGLTEPIPAPKASSSYPFPGMGVSEQEQLDSGRPEYSAQLLQQLMQDQQKYDCGIESLPLHYNAQRYENDAQHKYQIQQHQLLLLQQQQQQQPQQQQQQQLWYGQYHSRDPFVS